ncbi:SPOR domain-containing protein [Vibrio sp. S9_S30]|nr:SPOR domain-containing protein [Vibrio sp. S9_S30]
MVSAMSPAQASEYLCDATQASTNELPILKAECPIGEGLWGKRGPSRNAELFWIQCGIVGKPLPLWHAKKLYRSISTDVWMMRYGKEYRCLIGPYDDYAMALKEWRQVRKIPKYSDAFIREIKNQSTVSAPAQPVPVTPTKPVAQLSSSPAPTPEESKAIAPPPPSTAAKAAKMDIIVRRQAKLDGKAYAIPFIRDYEHFYMENDKPWNRMDYDSATEVCGLLGMRLATQREWKGILESNELSRSEWPLHLPYWGISQQGLFTSGKVTQLKGSSLLNVLCIQS